MIRNADVIKNIDVTKNIDVIKTIINQGRILDVADTFGTELYTVLLGQCHSIRWHDLWSKLEMSP